MNGDINYREQNHFLYQAVNMCLSAVSQSVLTIYHGGLWGLTRGWSLPKWPFEELQFVTRCHMAEIQV